MGQSLSEKEMHNYYLLANGECVSILKLELGGGGGVETIHSS